MQDLKFHYAKAVNILCFGPEGVELHLGDYSNLVQIHGRNLDISGPDDDPGSNGVGKSSIQEILSIALFGRTVKETKKCKGGHFINVLADDGMVEVQWNNCRVVRTFKRSKSGTVTSRIDIWESDDRIWDNASKVSKGEANQEWINDKIKLNHFAFCNVVIFDDSDAYAFLEADTPTRRDFVENLLGLDQYKQYHENAKSYLKDQKKLVERLNVEYQRLLGDIDSVVERIKGIQRNEATWKQSKQNVMKDLMARIKSKQAELETTGVGEKMSRWQTAQERIADIQREIETKESKRQQTNAAIQVAQEKLKQSNDSADALAASIHKQTLIINALESEMNQHSKLIQKMQSLEEGTRCGTCYGLITKENFETTLLHEQNAVEGCATKIRQEELSVAKLKEDLKKKYGDIALIKDKIRGAEEGVQSWLKAASSLRKELSDLSQIPKPDAGSSEKILENQIAELKRQLSTQKQEYDDSPYKELLEQAEAEHSVKKQESVAKGEAVKEAESEMPYYEFWVNAFGDKGIRKYIVDGIMPALNTRTSYWLGYLTDGMIQVQFDNEMEHAITRKGNTAYYPSMSKGEKRKVNLAVSQGFAYVMTLNYGTCPYQIFLDEVTGGGIDRASTIGVYSMILELAKERQVFVTTHNENLLSMLQGCETICLRKENDVTVLLN